jgi:hypothetical protein
MDDGHGAYAVLHHQYDILDTASEGTSSMMSIFIGSGISQI